jgi:hypothetical protein
LRPDFLAARASHFREPIDRKAHRVSRYHHLQLASIKAYICFAQTDRPLAAAMANQGEASNYYGGNNGYQMNQPPPQQQGYGYGAPQQNGYGPPSGPPPQQHNYGGGMPPPPNYGQQYNGDQKPQFEEAFKIEKPKWNDLWAGILFILVCAGYVAVSAISIQGYAATKGFNGGGIYDSNNQFGLTTNTIVLFMFCLGVALVLGYGYVWLARSK